MMLPCDLSAKLRSLFPLLEKHERKQASASNAVDIFESEPLYSQELSDFTIRKTRETLDDVQKRAAATFRVISTQSTGASLALDLRMRLRESARSMREIEEKALEGRVCARQEIVGIRRELFEIDCQAEKLKLRHIASSIENCTTQAHALLDLVGVMRAIRDGDKEFVEATVCRYPLFAARKPNKTTYDILKRFASSQLNALCERGLAFSLSHEELKDQYSKVERQILELVNFEQRAQNECDEVFERFEEVQNWGGEKNSLWELWEIKKNPHSRIEESLQKLDSKRKQLKTLYYCRGRYYGLKPNDSAMFRNLLVLLDTAGVPILHERSVYERIMQTFFKGHIEMLKLVGVMECFSFSEVRALVKDGKCAYSDFVAKEKKYYRISEYGSAVLKSVSRMVLPPRFDPPPKVEPSKPKPPPVQPVARPIGRGNGYKIIHLDQSIEFY